MFERAVLVLEAPLSTFHNAMGNPEIRGEFERGRGWYHGPGAVALLATQHFLQQLEHKLGGRKPVLLAEAFLSNKPQRTAHSADALAILRRFWRPEPEPLKSGVEPLLGLVEGIPEVRVF